MIHLPLRQLALPVLAMTIVVVASNVLVQFPFEPFGLGDYLTWGAFTYPVAFLVTDLTNRRYGAAMARKLVAVGFVIAVALSIGLATPRIALASGTAFLVGQLLDITVFNRLRRQAWWRAPLMGSVIGSVLDTALFFSLAFAALAKPRDFRLFGQNARRFDRPLALWRADECDLADGTGREGRGLNSSISHPIRY